MPGLLRRAALGALLGARGWHPHCPTTPRDRCQPTRAPPGHMALQLTAQRRRQYRKRDGLLRQQAACCQFSQPFPGARLWWMCCTSQLRVLALRQWDRGQMQAGTLHQSRPSCSHPACKVCPGTHCTKGKVFRDSRAFSILMRHWRTTRSGHMQC